MFSHQRQYLRDARGTSSYGESGVTNGPLRVLPGSHRAGKLGMPTSGLARQNRRADLPCSSGRVVLMRPRLLHASSPALEPQHRRVIHIEFASGRLAPGSMALGQGSRPCSLTKRLKLSARVD